MKAFTAKLVDLTQKNADAIARQWAKDVKTNAKTGSYHEASKKRSFVRPKSSTTIFK